MISATITIGGILTVISIILGFVLVKATPKTSYKSYIPSAIFFFGGLILLLFATLVKVDILGAGFGGWGIASLFAAAIGFVVTATTDSFQQETQSFN